MKKGIKYLKRRKHQIAKGKRRWWKEMFNPRVVKYLSGEVNPIEKW